jgi:BirA family biotin operon repressor/biotin-[acetyl-CoA-carboxylase] ligase
VIIIGVGINVSQRAFPRALADQATSIWLESGGVVDRDALLAGLLGEFDAWRGRLEREGFGPVRERWLARAETIGRMVTVDGLAGLALDLDAEGALLVRAGTALHRVRAGEVHAAGR